MLGILRNVRSCFTCFFLKIVKIAFFGGSVVHAKQPAFTRKNLRSRTIHAHSRSIHGGLSFHKFWYGPIWSRLSLFYPIALKSNRDMQTHHRYCTFWALPLKRHKPDRRLYSSYQNHQSSKPPSNSGTNLPALISERKNAFTGAKAAWRHL